MQRFVLGHGWFLLNASLAIALVALGGHMQAAGTPQADSSPQHVVSVQSGTQQPTTSAPASAPVSSVTSAPPSASAYSRPSREREYGDD